MLKIATWNVNSLRMRFAHLTDWLIRHSPDMVALQETKVQDHDFPAQAIQEAGYQVIFAGQKTFNGVAILSKTPAIEILFDIPHFEDHQRRIIAATIDGIRVINVYVPNGSEVGSEKYQYKLHWLTHLTQFLKQELTAHEKVIVLGDFNVAPEDQDVHDPKAWEGSVLVSEKERQALRKIMDLGFADLFRQFTQPPQSFSWWDYRNGGYWKGEGLRIDLVLANQALAAQCRACMIDVRPRKLKSPSDHAPVIAEFAKFA